MICHLPNGGSRPARGWAYHARPVGRVGHNPIPCVARVHPSKPATVLADNDDQKNGVGDGLKPECCARHVSDRSCACFFIHQGEHTQSNLATVGKPVDNLVDYKVRSGHKHNMSPYVDFRNPNMAPPNRKNHRCPHFVHTEKNSKM